MTENNLTIVVFKHDDIALPAEWPESVGIAVIDTGSAFPDLYPVHDSETPDEIIRRLEIETMLDLESALYYPPADGREAPDMGFEGFRIMSLKYEKGLHRNAEALEEAHDFAINFDFAEDYGIPVEGVRVPPPEDEAEEPEGIDAPSDPEAENAEVDGEADQPENPEEQGAPDQETSSPPGYHPAEAEDREAETATVKVTRKGDVSIAFKRGGLSWTSRKASSLVRADRAGVAFRAADITDENGRMKPVEVPAGHLSVSGMPPGFSCMADVTFRDGHVFVTPAPWRRTTAKPVGSLVRSCCIGGALVMLCVAAYLAMGPLAENVPSDPADRLQQEMFGNAPSED